LYTTGIRIGEALSLLWSDIDFDGGQVVVSNREPTANIPPFFIKDHETRHIPMPERTVKMLTQLHREAPEGVPFVFLDAERWERVKSRWQECQAKNKHWGRFMCNNINRDFKHHIRRAGIKPIGTFAIHTLRKNAIQNWADHLPINVVQNLAGHSKAETTLEFYSQVDQQHRDTAAKVIQEILDKQGVLYAQSTPEPVFNGK